MLGEGVEKVCMGDVESENTEGGGLAGRCFFVNTAIKNSALFSFFGEDAVFPFESVGARFDLSEGF